MFFGPVKVTLLKLHSSLEKRRSQLWAAGVADLRAEVVAVHGLHGCSEVSSTVPVLMGRVGPRSATGTRSRRAS